MPHSHAPPPPGHRPHQPLCARPLVRARRSRAGGAVAGVARCGVDRVESAARSCRPRVDPRCRGGRLHPAQRGCVVSASAPLDAGMEADRATDAALVEAQRPPSAQAAAPDLAAALAAAPFMPSRKVEGWERVQAAPVPGVRRAGPFGRDGGADGAAVLPVRLCLSQLGARRGVRARLAGGAAAGARPAGRHAARPRVRGADGDDHARRRQPGRAASP